MSGRVVVVLEAESAIGTHTSSRNSDLIHAGIYYQKGSLKAQACVRGKQLLYEYCAAHGVPHIRASTDRAAPRNARRSGPRSVTATGVTRLDEVAAGTVRFVPWFVRDGGAWIEHGHVFDSACSTRAQLSPTRGGGLVKSVAEVATRRFTNLMPEIDYDAADKFSVIDYLRWALARGWRFMI